MGGEARPGCPLCSGDHTSNLDALAEAVAAHVVALLAPDDRSTLVDAATLARALGVSADYVYRHADMLGVKRLGDGKRARLRFDVQEATARLASEGSEGAPARTETGKRRRRASAAKGTSAGLVPGGAPPLRIGPKRGTR